MNTFIFIMMIYGENIIGDLKTIEYKIPYQLCSNATRWECLNRSINSWVDCDNCMCSSNCPGGYSRCQIKGGGANLEMRCRDDGKLIIVVLFVVVLLVALLCIYDWLRYKNSGV